MQYAPHVACTRRRETIQRRIAVSGRGLLLRRIMWNSIETHTYSLFIAGLTLLAGLALYAILSALMSRYHARRTLSVDGMPVRLDLLRAPLRALLPAVCLRLAVPLMHFPPDAIAIVGHALWVWVIGAAAWLGIRSVTLLRTMVMARYDMDERDNLKARRVYTQFRVIERVVDAVLILLAIAAMLLTFHAVRRLGVSLLASAGMAGIIVGFAAQRSLATLVAGIQIAISQPIRIEDVVIVEGEWGWIEEITLTYVVVRIWDQRRLIVPITYFIEKPFQNWTRTSAQILGTVFIYADYTVPVGSSGTSSAHSGEYAPVGPQGLEPAGHHATEHTVELRALMSAEDSSRAWDLRCLVRERLIAFLQATSPRCLPRVRLEREPGNQGDQGPRVPDSGKFSPAKEL